MTISAKRTLFGVSMLTFSICVFSGEIPYRSDNGSPARAGFAIPPVPYQGFDTFEALQMFATNSTPGGGTLTKYESGGDSVWVMIRQGGLGGSIVEISGFVVDGNCRMVFYLPFSVGVFIVDDVHKGFVSVKKMVNQKLQLYMEFNFSSNTDKR